jgi:hypothetical protein
MQVSKQPTQCNIAAPCAVNTRTSAWDRLLTRGDAGTAETRPEAPPARHCSSVTRPARCIHIHKVEYRDRGAQCRNANDGTSAITNTASQKRQMGEQTKPNGDRPLLCWRLRTSHTNDLTGWLNTSTDPSAFCCLYKPPAAAVPVGVPGDAAAGLIGAAGGAVTGCWATGCSKKHNDWLTGHRDHSKGCPQRCGQLQIERQNGAGATSGLHAATSEAYLHADAQHAWG